MRVTPVRLRTLADSVATCSLLLTLAVLIGIGLLSYNSTRRFLRNDQQVAHTYQVLDGLDHILADLQNAETGQRGYLLTGDPAYLSPYQTGRAASQHDILQVRALTRDNPAQQQRLETLRSLSAAKLAELDRTITLRQQAGPAAALRVVETGSGKALMDQAREAIGRMRSAERLLLAQRTAAAEQSGGLARLWDVIGSVLAVILIVTAIGFVSNYLRQRESAEAESLRLAEAARDAAVRQRVFLKDVLASVTEGRLALCDTADELPPPLLEGGKPIPLTRAAGLRELRQAAIRTALACGFSEDRIHDLATSVSEAGMNAITHGGGGEAVIRSDRQERVQVCITDFGKGIALDALPQSTLERGYSSAGSLGHGFWLMLRMCDRVSLLTGPAGTTVVLEQAKIAQEAPWKSYETSQPPLTFRTINSEGSGSASDVRNLSFRTRLL